MGKGYEKGERTFPFHSIQTHTHIAQVMGGKLRQKLLIAVKINNIEPNGIRMDENEIKNLLRIGEISLYRPTVK